MWLLNDLPCHKAYKNLVTDGQDQALFLKLLSSSQYSVSNKKSYDKKSHTCQEGGSTSEFLFGIYWWASKTNF